MLYATLIETFEVKFLLRHEERAYKIEINFVNIALPLTFYIKNYQRIIQVQNEASDFQFKFTLLCML